MKYYELYVNLYWMSDVQVTIQELNVIKETEKQLQIKGSKTYLSRVNKSNLMVLNENSSDKYIFFVEGQEEQAKDLMLEALQRDLDFHIKKVTKYRQAIKEL